LYDKDFEYLHGPCLARLLFFCRYAIMRSRGIFHKNSGSGIGGSGIFALLGTTIKCDADDASLYCSFMKLMNVLIMSLFLFYVVWLAYMIIGPIISKAFRKRR